MTKWSSAQNSILPAVSADIALPPLPILPLSNLAIACDINNAGGNPIVGVVVEEQNAFGQPFQFRFVLYNGGTSNIITISPATLIMGWQPNTTTPYPSFTEIFNPDIVLLNNGTKAIITFDTDDPTYGAYWVEYDINPVNLTVIQNTAFYAGCVPITHLYTGTNIYSHAARIDRSFDANNLDAFAIVALQDFYNTLTEIPVITYFEDNGFSFQFNPTIIYQPAIPPGSTSKCYNPDIAIGYDQVNNEICAAVCFVRHDPINPFAYTVSHVGYRPSSPLLFASNYTNNVLTSIPFVVNVVKPRICAPPYFNTAPINDLPFGLCYSNSPLQPMWSNANLYYAHYDVTGLNTVNPDAQNAYSTSYCGEPVIEYMQDSPGQTAREACMAWPAMLNTGPNPSFGIFALMDPFININFYNWSQVNFTPITTPNNIRYCTAIAGSWDGGMDRYVIAWLTDNILSLKIRQMHVTNYKTMPISTQNHALPLYPNPAKDVINLKTNSKESKPYTILNYQGINISRGMTSSNAPTQIEVSHLNNGIYFIQHDGQTNSFTINR